MTGIIPRRFRPASIALAFVALLLPYFICAAVISHTRSQAAVAVATAKSEAAADREVAAAVLAAHDEQIAHLTAQRDKARAEVAAVSEDNAALVARLKHKPRVRASRKAHREVKASRGWQTAGASWYGPGFYGHTMAGGGKLTKQTMGVAHRSLPFGTRVAFRNPRNGRSVTVTVTDRGPFVGGRLWDLCPGTARALGMYYTGTVQYRVLR